jgi:signal transduction histidine kinase
VRPLEQLPSLKLKLGIVIVAAIVATLVAMVIATSLGLRRGWGVLVAIPLALVVVQVLARGMTSRLREIATAADAMARGEHGQQVDVSGRDEVARLAIAFNEMSAELAETDRQRRELVANVSHELRTPLAALQATLDNVVDGVQPADPGTLAAMRRQVHRLGRMVEQLLDLSRMEAESAPLDRSAFPAAKLLERVRGEALLQARDVEVETHTTPEDLTLMADEERIHQVLTNLVENALRFSPKAGTVIVAASRNGKAVRLEVADQGPGIPEEARERVFERFYSVDESRSGGGAGLGLAIARWIVDLHGGTIRVDEAPSKGCRMLVELPQATAGRPGND